MKWIPLVQDRVQRPLLVDMIMNFHIKRQAVY
jgi:hypothetical protein